MEGKAWEWGWCGNEGMGAERGWEKIIAYGAGVQFRNVRVTLYLRRNVTENVDPG